MIRTLISCVVLATSFAGCARTPVLAETKDDRSTVTMNGTGIVRRAPDVATLVLRIDSRAPKPTPAQQRAAEISSALIARLGQVRIPDKNVQTVSYELSRDYDYVKGQPIFRGWVASHVFVVHIEEIARLGDIIDAIESAGPISIDGPHFDFKSAATVYAEALKEAVADARGKADAAAQGSGARVMRVVNIEEQAPSAPQPRVLAERSAPSAPQTQVSPGELTIEARVTLTAEIR